MTKSTHSLFLILAGPAGSGKSTLCERLVHAGLGFSRVVTATTRTPRLGEINGIHYHFFSPVQFDEKLAQDEFLEWAWVHGDRRYGTPASSVLGPLARGESLVANLDVQGVASIRRACAQHPLLARSLATVFIHVSWEQLQRRIRERGADDEAEIARRMATAETERREAGKFDYHLDSTSREADFAALLTIVQQARAKLAATLG